MKHTLIALAITLNLVMSACKHKEDYESRIIKTITTIDKGFNSNPETIYYLIIPKSGCTGCISEAELFVRNDIKEDMPLKVIFTRINSLKIIKAATDDIPCKSKILYDENNLITYKEQSNEIYPMLMLVKNGRCVSITYQSPGNSIIKEFN